MILQSSMSNAIKQVVKEDLSIQEVGEVYTVARD